MITKLNSPFFRFVGYNGLFALLPYLIIFIAKSFQSADENNSLTVGLFLLFSFLSYASSVDAGLIRYTQKISQKYNSGKLLFHGSKLTFLIFILIPVVPIYSQINGIKEFNSYFNAPELLCLSILIIFSQGFINLFSNSFDVSGFYGKSFMLKVTAITIPLFGFMFSYFFNQNLFLALSIFFLLRLSLIVFTYLLDKNVQLFNFDSNTDRHIFYFSIIGNISNFAFLSLEKYTALNYLHDSQLQNYLITSDLITKATFLSGAFAQLTLNDSIHGRKNTNSFKKILALSFLSSALYLLSVIGYSFYFSKLIVFNNKILLSVTGLIVFVFSISQYLLIQIFLTSFGQQKVVVIQAITFILSIIFFIILSMNGSFTFEYYIMVLLFKTMFETSAFFYMKYHDTKFDF